MVRGETSARRNPRKGEVSVYPLWPSCRTFRVPKKERTWEECHFRCAEAEAGAYTHSPLSST
jgi:hypothetical protein